MKRNSFLSLVAALITGLAVLPCVVQAVPPPTFASTVVAKGKGFEITSTELEDAMITHKATKAAIGQPVPREAEPTARKEVLDRMIANRIFLGRATDADKKIAKETTAKFIDETRKRSPTEAAFKRQLLAIGLTNEAFQKEVEEQSLVKAVIDRELKVKQTVTDDEIAHYYETNKTEFTLPSLYKVRHILLTLRDPETRQNVSDAIRQGKMAKMKQIESKARKGGDFASLVAEYSEDRVSKALGGDYSFTSGQAPAEFEAAVATLKPGDISEIVVSRLGIHLIQLVQATPGKTKPFSEVKQDIKESLLQAKSQAALPMYIEQVKKEHGVEILSAK